MADERAEKKTVRSFVAVLLPPTLREDAAEIQDVVRDRMPPRSVRWVQPTNFHLTVRFLGDLDHAGVERVSELVQLQAGFAPIELTLGTVSAFPGPTRPSIIWIDLIDREGNLEGLVQRVERGLIGGGFGPPDKPWRSHLTLGRVQRGARAPRDWHLVPAVPKSVYRVDTLALMQSELRPEGPRYTALETVHATP